MESFEAAGFSIVPFTQAADVYVINTCSVTSQAESKSMQTVRRANRLNPEGKVVVTGCAAQMALNKNESLECADLVIPNPEKLETFAYFSSAFPNLVEAAEKCRAPLSPRQNRTRATIKIQDGCSVCCSYCSIPYTRPQMRSRHYEEVITEVKDLGANGYKEIVLTGVLIGSYGPETGSGGPNFEDLIELLAEVPEIVRIRISSIEMRQVTERLVALIKSGKVVPHLHIPLQSGSTSVLKDMNRPYTQDDYIALCKNIYSEVPEIGISSDIMVGFPTEGDAQFLDSVHVCETVRFMKAHVFRFSPRYGTPADGLGDPVPAQTKTERSQELARVSNETRSEFFRGHIGKTVKVLVENSSGLPKGHTGNYLEVEFPGPSNLAGSIVSVRIISADANSALGEMVDGEESGLRILQNC